MPELTIFFRDANWIMVVSIIFLVVFIWLTTVGGKKYSTKDAEAHSQEFAGQVKEGHGPMTALLWVSFAVIAIWTIYYIFDHAEEFLVIFTQG